MLSAYLEALRQLRLAHHVPEKVGLYGRRYWKSKSKLPYRWKTARGPDNVPWIGFVGYQIHRGGALRVREQSVEKELAKQLSVVDEASMKLERSLRRAIKDGRRIPLRSIGALKYRLLLHLTSFSVGHAPPHGWEARHGRISWARGFPLLPGAVRDDAVIKRLDRGRRRAIGLYLRNVHRLVAKYGDAISRRGHTHPPGEREEDGDVGDRPAEPFRLRYDGWGLSYQRAIDLAPDDDEQANGE